jgi:hypothetical protein
MPNLFTGPIELSEYATTAHPAQFAGTQLRLVFRVSIDNSNPPQNLFPEIEVEVSRVGAWHKETVSEVCGEAHPLC